MASRQILARYSRHPLVVALIAAVLTGVGGIWFTLWLHDQDTQRDLLAATRVHGVAAIHELVDLINERRTRSVMVEYAIYRNSPAEAQDRWGKYNEVYVQWNTKEEGMELRTREFLQTVAPDDYQAYIDTFTGVLSSKHAITAATTGADAHVTPGLLAQMDSCLTDAYDRYRKAGFKESAAADAKLNECHFGKLDDDTVDCTAAIADSLFGIIGQLGAPQRGVQLVRDGVALIQKGCQAPAEAPGGVAK